MRRERRRCFRPNRRRTYHLEVAAGALEDGEVRIEAARLELERHARSDVVEAQPEDRPGASERGSRAEARIVAGRPDAARGGWDVIGEDVSRYAVAKGLRMVASGARNRRRGGCRWRRWRKRLQAVRHGGIVEVVVEQVVDGARRTGGW